MLQKTKSFIEKHEWLVPLGLFTLFLALTLPGISWGAPSGWHPDEIVIRSIKALHSDWKFSEINFDYPDLPQYAMFFLGKILLSFGKTDGDIRIASRVLSAVLAGLTVVLTYIVVRRMKGSIALSSLSGLLLICVSEMSHNGRFAHNDTYVTFFATLTILFLVNYKATYRRGWLYASFFAVGMAASSKYNSISLVIAPVLVLLISKRNSIIKHPLRTMETLLIGGGLTFLGFAIGTPKALTWMSYYFKRMVPALLRTGNYLVQPDSVRGFLGQYAGFAKGLGFPLFILFAIAFIWVYYEIYRTYIKTQERTHPQVGFLALLLLSLVALDLPILISYNYPIRFFLPMMPIFAIFGAFFVEKVYQQTKYGKIITTALIFIVIYSLAQNISVMLLFINDARIPASRFIRTLPLGTSLEYVYYPPSIPTGHFEREHNYPIYFRKAQNEPLPVSTRYDFNVGEIGLNKRETEYFVVDSFTSDKFNSPYTCADMQVECDFFKQLETGASEHYKLLAEFTYSLPPYLPHIEVDFVNPSIRIYERIP